MTSDLPIVIRAMRPTDFNLVVSSWVGDLVRNGPQWIKAMPRSARYRLVPSRVKELAVPENVKVACLEDDEDTVLGWACVSGKKIFYTYVKSAFRKFGIAALLLDGVPNDAVMGVETKMSKLLAREGKIPGGWTYDASVMWSDR